MLWDCTKPKNSLTAGRARFERDMRDHQFAISPQLHILFGSSVRLTEQKQKTFSCVSSMGKSFLEVHGRGGKNLTGPGVVHKASDDKTRAVI